MCFSRYSQRTIPSIKWTRRSALSRTTLLHIVNNTKRNCNMHKTYV